MIWARMKSI